MAATSGCDYAANVRGLGLRGISRFFNRYTPTAPSSALLTRYGNTILRRNGEMKAAQNDVQGSSNVTHCLFMGIFDRRRTLSTVRQFSCYQMYWNKKPH